jgi:hypothetical protein
VKTDVKVSGNDDRLRIDSHDTGLAIEVDLTSNDGLPEGTPFSRWEDARKFSGPLPFTFTCEADKKRVLIVEGVRSDWKPLPVRVLRHDIPFLSQLGHGNAILANAFVVRNIPYHWKKGSAEPWPNP